MNLLSTKRLSPFFRWLLLCLALLIPFLILTWEYFQRGFSSDASGITYVIFVIFILGFLSSIMISKKISKETNELKEIGKNHHFDIKKSGVHALFRQAKTAIDQGDQIDFNILLTSYSARMATKVRGVGTTAGILITVGLLGTVVGLILTINGISSVLGAAGEDYTAMIGGLNDTVQGMGTAFYTTFFGGLFGGVILKALAADNEKAANRLTADCLELGELWIMPMSRTLASKMAGNLQTEVLGLMNTLRDLGNSISKTSEVIEQNKVIMDRQFTNLVAEAKSEMSQSLQKGLSEMITGFDSIVKTIETGHEPIKSKMEELSDAIGNAASATSDAVEETKNVQNKILDGRALELANKLNAAAGLIEKFIDDGDEKISSGSDSND
tara:strand:- start:364 stop:1515 length:1152 start_codon:yes stop_codon:yes gene_type:complete